MNEDWSKFNNAKVSGFTVRSIYRPNTTRKPSQKILRYKDQFKNDEYFTMVYLYIYPKIIQIIMGFNFITNADLLVQTDIQEDCRGTGK